MSAYIAIDEGRGVLEIGNTYIVSEKRGTGFNRMVKQLMIDRAFSCGFRRIEFRVAARNRRSPAALATLGRVRDAVIRAARITWPAHLRAPALFSLLDPDSPSG